MQSWRHSEIPPPEHWYVYLTAPSQKTWYAARTLVRLPDAAQTLVRLPDGAPGEDGVRMSIQIRGAPRRIRGLFQRFPGMGESTKIAKGVVARGLRVNRSADFLTYAMTSHLERLSLKGKRSARCI